MWWQTKFHPAIAFTISLCLTTTLAIASEQPNSDYIDIVLTQTRHKVFRFKTMPVPVFIEKCTTEEKSACTNAFETWQEGTNSQIRFENVPEAKSARIIIKFVNLPQAKDTSSGANSDGGHTMMKWQSKKLLNRVFGRSKFSVPPQILEVNLSALDARPAAVRSIVLQNIVAHELGHAIGLLAHSAESGDLMYTQTDENSKLSTRDINTVRKLYQLKSDINL